MAKSQKGVAEQIQEKEKELFKLEKQYLEILPDEKKMKMLDKQIKEIQNEIGKLEKDFVKNTVQECFEELMLKVGIDKHKVGGILGATFDMANSMKEVLKNMTKQLLEGQLRSVVYLDNQNQKAEHVKKINELNWSHCNVPFKDSNGKEQILNDIGSTYVNIKKAERRSTKNPFAVLEMFVIDVDNNISYKMGSKKCKIDFIVKKTSNNDRSRSRLQERKTNSSDLNLNEKQDANFAKMFNEYGVLWYIRFNGGEEGD